MFSSLGIVAKSATVATCIGVGVSVVGAGGYVGYTYKDQILGNYTTDMTSTEFVYIAVKPTKTQSSDVQNQVTLTSTVGSNVTKNYQCSLASDVSVFVDNDCTLIKWNSQTPDSKTLDLTSLSLPSQQVTDKSVFSAQDHMVLKISKKLYSELIKKGQNQNISIVQKNKSHNLFGTVAREFDITKDASEGLSDVKSNVFLMRIKEVVDSPTIPTSDDAYKCKLSDTETVDCKIYKTTAKNDTNDLTHNDLNSLAKPDSSNTVVGKYLVVDLGETRKSFSELKNRVIEVETSTDAATASNNKKIKLVPDQILFGFVSSIISTSTFYSLTPKLETYLVSKKTDGNFNTIESTTKNYKCKHAAGTNETEDNSCLIKVFPALTSDGKKVHAYADVVAKTSFTAISSADTSSKDHFLLTVDANKLFNLKPTWATDETVEVAIKPNTGTETTTTFTLLQKVMPNQATGKTNLAMLKYKNTDSDSSSTWTLQAGKCAFSSTDSTGFGCGMHLATLTNSEMTTANITSTATTPLTEPSADSYYVVKLTDLKNISEFNNKTIFYHTTTDSKKYVFDIVALMGGDIANNKTTYFLENKRI